MEMENSRRSFDRSRELGLKKPRLDEQIIGRNSNGRAFVQQQAESASMRARDIEGSSDTSIQELASQYRTALAELTFNSKPIITNLTIIAGESLHAAKAIAAIICSNILEVPTEQKLPSLYLLDSIVKNIGRDYIKYFAARLPEVFCKAYRQVDPAVHPGMRHLFGTWRNVFPPQSLQMIEKELKFPPAVSGSASGTTTSKPGSQTQRPAQSIHVNPKYLEARQHQQSSKVKGTISDMNGSHGNSPDDSEKSERTTNLNSARQRADPRLKMHNIQHPPRDAGTASFQHNSSEFGAYDYNIELARQSATGIRKTSDRVRDQGLDRAWYGSDSSTTETASGQRNGSDIKHRHTNYLASVSANSDANLQNAPNLVSGRSSIGMDRSWKNSEEEEYMWDDVNSRSTNYGVNRKSKRDPRLMDDSERLDTQSPILKSQILHENESSVDREAFNAALLSEQKKQTALGNRATSTGPRAALGIVYPVSDQTNSGLSEGYPASLSGLSTNLNSMGRTSFPLPNNFKFGTSAMSGKSGAVVQQRYSVEAASPSGQSPMHQRPSSPSLSVRYSNQEPLQPESLPHVNNRTQTSGKSNFELRSQLPQNLPIPAQTVTQTVHRGSTQNSQPQNLQSSSYMNSFQQRHHIPSLQRLQSDPIEYDPSAPSPKPILPQVSVVEKPSKLEKSSSGHSSLPASQMPGQVSASCLLTAVMESGILGKNSVRGSIPKDSCQTAIQLPFQSSSQPSLPSGPPPTQSEVKVASTTPVSSLSHESTPVSSAQRQTERLPRPHGPPPSSIIGSALEQTANVVNAASNPMSSLLNTLVAKGLISASKTESAASFAPQLIADPCNQIPGTVIAPMVSSTLPVSSAISPSSTGKDLSLSKPTAQNPVAIHVSSLNDVKSHIGFEFKPDVIRASHPIVISELHDDLPHQCNICGLRVKLKERFERHMEWHALKKSESDSPNKASRRWYVNFIDWVGEKVSTHPTIDMKEVSYKDLETGVEQMVPADENHCVCVLCGELFEDLYNQKTDKWMFKGAVYLTPTTHSVITSLTGEKGPIVHANCISESSLRDLGLANDAKVENDA